MLIKCQHDTIHPRISLLHQLSFHHPKKYIPNFHATLIVAGCDEAGRGPWAGPVVTAAVIIPPRTRLPKLNDSKKIPEAVRENLFKLITAKCHVGIGISTHEEIDHLGIIPATHQAFNAAINQLAPQPDHILIDGRDKFTFPMPKTSIIKGDSKLRCIAAASIIAKVTRDRLMYEYHQTHPQYRFDLHKGYGTRLHHQLLKQHGACHIHRKTYQPIKALTSSVRVTNDHP